jgi:hypothetical protein
VGDRERAALTGALWLGVALVMAALIFAMGKPSERALEDRAIQALGTAAGLGGWKRRWAC